MRVRSLTLVLPLLLAGCTDAAAPEAGAPPVGQPVVDSASPTWDSDAAITLHDAGPRHLTLSWDAATDTETTVRYRLSIAGALLAEVHGTSHVLTELTPSTTYALELYAYDDADHVAASHLELAATTRPSWSTSPPAPPRLR